MATPPPTPWHRLLGALLDAVLSPVGIRGEMDIAVTAEPPRADILLLRHDQPHWNEAQRQQLTASLYHCLKMQILEYPLPLSALRKN